MQYRLSWKGTPLKYRSTLIWSCCRCVPCSRSVVVFWFSLKFLWSPSLAIPLVFAAHILLWRTTQLILHPRPETCFGSDRENCVFLKEHSYWTNSNAHNLYINTWNSMKRPRNLCAPNRDHSVTCTCERIGNNRQCCKLRWHVFCSTETGGE